MEPNKTVKSSSLENLMTPTEVATVLGIPERTLGQWAWLKTGPEFVKVGRHRRYRPEAITAYLEAHTIRNDRQVKP